MSATAKTVARFLKEAEEGRKVSLYPVVRTHRGSTGASKPKASKVTVLKSGSLTPAEVFERYGVQVGPDRTDRRNPAEMMHDDFSTAKLDLEDVKPLIRHARREEALQAVQPFAPVRMRRQKVLGVTTGRVDLSKYPAK